MSEVTNVVVLSDYRATKRRAAAGPAASVGELFVSACFTDAFSWIEAMGEAADLFLVPGPSGIDDLPV